jgi:Glycerophosphoryl diester phosphodiesterase family
VLPALYAHHLGRVHGPDWSLAALHRAIQQPLDGLETDCGLTADGQLVLPHDPLLELGTTMSGWANQSTAAEIRRGVAASSRRHIKRRAARCCTSCSTSRRPIRQLEVKAHANPATARRTARAVCERLRDHPRGGADRDHQLLVRCMRARQPLRSRPRPRSTCSTRLSHLRVGSRRWGLTSIPDHTDRCQPLITVGGVPSCRRRECREREVIATVLNHLEMGTRDVR